MMGYTTYMQILPWTLAQYIFVLGVVDGVNRSCLMRTITRDQRAVAKQL